MKAKDLESFKNILLKRRDEVIIELREQGVGKNELNSNENRYGMHIADTGSDTIQNELNSYSEHRRRKYLHHIEMALERIENGQYGKCIVCGKEISEKRLKAVPHTQHCIPCKI